MTPRNLKLFCYALVLLAAPVIEAGLFYATFRAQGFLLFAVAVFSWFVMPRGAWWRLTLVGAVWQDVYLLWPVGMTVVGVLIAGGTLALVSLWLTSRSFWTDAVTAALAYGAALAIVTLWQLVITRLDTSTMFVWPTAAGILGIAMAFIVAAWLHRNAARHQYLR